MNQGGVKNVVTEPTRLENKRERRRGAAGRAAALRRAPSDSDCSGETASLSADSGDRAPRPPPQPTRAGKNRGRRRGSEWEVLEGLKDGQRFEKRPDVFNGYLHKKRKWPLKGWHKRFFVVDGGILVYARSPTDVARGRLHGSVDVGLSVISAKARRRRIDIDADEFIYHLRAKTPDVFRTWLNVLKAHRLYRQHLLTFGARESVPKIHAPLEDLPPTDNSSRISNESLDFSSECSSDDSPFTRKKEQSPELQSCYTCSPISFSTPIDKEKEYNPPKPKIGDGHFNDKLLNNHKSLCSMNCVARFTVDELQRKKSPNISEGSTEGEKQIHSTDLDISSTKTTDTALADAEKTKRETSPFRYSESKQPLLTDNKVKPTAAYYFFTRNKSRSSIINTQMRKSKKSTNLVKYRNFIDEPPLRRPLSKSMLLGRYKTKTEKKSNIEKLDNSEKSTDRAVACDTVQTESNEVQASSIENKSLQDAMTTSDYDNITERLMVSIFENAKNTTVTDVQLYIQQVVKDLYDIKFQEVHPVKALFRSLLEYWLKNTKVEPIKTAMRHSRSIDRQSNKYFTRDENLSSVYIGRVSKQTQFHGLSEMLFQYKKKPNTAKPVPKPPDRPPSSPSPRRDTESFEKERRIQELERLLKNTVYMCETTRSNQQKDIKITKTLIDNIGKLPPKTEEDSPTGLNKDNSNSSTEKIQETLNHLLSDTSISPDVAKEFFSAYLDILLKEDFRSLSETSSPSSEHSVASKGSKELPCQVEAEAVTKTASKSVTTLKDTQVTQPKSSDAFKPIDPGQLYLKEVLDRITTIFSKVKKMEDTTWTNEKSHENVKGDFKELEQKDELGRPDKEYPGKKLIYENYDENSVVIDLSKYDLQHISMFNDPALEGIMSISIKLKEKPPTMTDNKHAHLSLQFADSNSLKKEEVQKELKQNWLSYIQSTNSNEIFEKRSKSPDAYADFAKKFDLKPYSSSSDATSKAYKVVHESEHSLDISFKNSFLRGLDPKRSFDNEDTSCYMMSFKKEPTKFQPKKRVRLKDYNGISKRRSPCRSPTRQPDLSIFEQPAPRVIDEKFILLLLENLSLLSKNIPSLHKDINSLFVKLRKKHEKILKNCGNVYGLSLLGKIYNEDSECGACRKDASTQWDVVTCYPLSEEVSITEKAINTCSNTKIRKNVKDAYTSAIDLKLVLNCEVQTKSEGEKILYCYERGPPSLGDTSLTENLVKLHSIHRIKLTEMDKKTAEHSASCPKSVHKIATECSMTALIKRVLDPEGRLNTTTNPTSREHMIKKKKISSKLRQDLIKEITLLSPSFKVSTQSQTDRRLLRFVREKWMEKDFKVYQLFYSKKYNVTRASSATDSNVEVNPSDELKTLYRCTSDPSYCSGLLSPTGGPIRGPQAGFVSGTPGGRLSGWIIESGGPLENASRELGQAQLSVQQLQRLLDALELQQQIHHDTDGFPNKVRVVVKSGDSAS